jgi:hypothetical protein
MAYGWDGRHDYPLDMYLHHAEKVGLLYLCTLRLASRRASDQMVGIRAWDGADGWLYYSSIYHEISCTLLKTSMKRE